MGFLLAWAIVFSLFAWLWRRFFTTPRDFWELAPIKSAFAEPRERDVRELPLPARRRRRNRTLRRFNVRLTRAFVRLARFLIRPVALIEKRLRVLLVALEPVARESAATAPPTIEERKSALGRIQRRINGAGGGLALSKPSSTDGAVSVADAAGALSTSARNRT